MAHPLGPVHTVRVNARFACDLLIVCIGGGEQIMKSRIRAGAQVLYKVQRKRSMQKQPF